MRLFYSQRRGRYSSGYPRMAEAPTTADSYVVRPYEPSDREDVLSLYERLLDRNSSDWFDWRHRENPYVSDPPIFVADHRGRVVGARSSVPIRLRIGGRPETAIVQIGAMVHPDHQRQGLFTRMVTEMYDYYAEREPIISIGFPNEKSAPALLKLESKLKLDHSITEPLSTYYRIEKPSAFADELSAGALSGVASRVGDVGASAYFSVRDALRTANDTVSVEYYEEVPISELASFASRTVTDEVHTVRDEEFYRWRYSCPDYDYAAHVARRGGSLVGAVVTGTGESDGRTVTEVVDTLPVSDRPDRDAVASSLLGAVVERNRHSDAFVAGGWTMPDRVLRNHGFLPNTSYPLSLVRPNKGLFIARPLTNENLSEWVVNGQSLSNADNWRMSLLEKRI